MRNAPWTPTACISAIRDFRERSSGVPEMLEVLRAAGGQLIVATSKPRYLPSASRAFRVCGVAGGRTARIWRKRSSKIDVIRYAMRERGITPSSAVMVGDRKYDITGAREAGLADIGVLYGYGSREELVEAGAAAGGKRCGSAGNAEFFGRLRALWPFCVVLMGRAQGRKIPPSVPTVFILLHKSHKGVMKPSRCGDTSESRNNPASEERYEHLSIGCIAMDDGTGTFGVAVAPDVSGDFSQMSR